MPPPRVSPPTPVVRDDAGRRGQAEGAVAWSTSPQVQPPSTRTVLVRLDRGAPHRAEVDDQRVVADAQPAGVVAAAADGEVEPCSRAKPTPATRQPTSAQRAMAAGRLSIIPL